MSIRLGGAAAKAARVTAREPERNMAALYGLVDPARDPRIYPLVKKAPEYRCLFGGPLDLSKERTAPHIVGLDTGSEFKDAWLQEGWGQSWGIMCYAPGSLAEVRRHFRHFLQVMLPDRRLGLFRFYDPRIWRVYLPTCNAEELGHWFEMVEEFVVEAPYGKGMIRYLFRDGKLESINEQV
jgi:hypothetical protein